MTSPTIGRKLWYWPTGDVAVKQYNPTVACDATVIYPWSDTCVNLRVTDHEGTTHIRTSVILVQDKDGPVDGYNSHATWMPYQRATAAVAAQTHSPDSDSQEAASHP